MQLKFDYTKDNHLKWGFGDGWFNPQDSASRFKFAIGNCTRPEESFRNECIRAASDIANSTQKPIIVGLSGGCDSQTVCLALRAAKAPFSVVIVRLIDKNNELINGEDIKNAYLFCETFNIKFIEHNIELDEFYKQKGVERAIKYGLYNIRTMIQTATMDFVCGEHCYIMAGGDIILTPYLPWQTPELKLPLLTNGFVKPVWWQDSIPIMQYMINMGYEGTTKFFLYSPELILSYLDDEIMKSFYLAQDSIYDAYYNNTKQISAGWKCFQYYIKPLLMHRHWPELLPVRKRTGFEKLENLYSLENLDYYRKIIKANVDKFEQVVVFEMTNLINHLRDRDSEKIFYSTPIKKLNNLESPDYANRAFADSIQKARSYFKR